MRLPMPIRRARAASDDHVETRSSKPFGAASPWRILVVDGNRDSATSLAMLLKLNGYVALTAFDGLEAVEVAARSRPDAIFMDIGLPKLNGHEAARKIRVEAWGKNIVLVALTGWGQDEDRQLSLDSEFRSHLVKPVDHAILTKLLADLAPTPT